MSDIDAYYLEFKHELARCAIPIYFVGMARIDPTYSKVYLFRVPDSEGYAAAFRKAVRRCGLVDEVITVPRAIASSVAALWFKPFENEVDWHYVDDWKCEFLSATDDFKPYSRCSRRGREFIMGMVQGGR